MPRWANILGFQLIWLALVSSPRYGLDWLAVILLVVWLLLHLGFSANRGHELRVVAITLLLGPCCDVLLIQLDLIRYAGLSLSANLPPLWIYAQWANFSLLLNHSLGFVRGRLWLTTPMALISAPLAYYSGDLLDAAQLAEPVWLPLIVVAQCWLLILAAISKFSASGRRS